MRSTGTTISGIAHVGLITWLVLGWGFSSEPLPFDVTEVSVVSGEEYARIVQATSPNPDDAAPETPVTPEVDETPPEPTIEETPEPPATPDPVEEPVEDTAPPEPPEPPAPVSDVLDEVPDVTSPDLVEQPEVAEPITSDTPNSRQTDVIAPLPTPEPEVDTAVSVETTPAVVPEETPEEPAVEPEEATVAEDTSQTTTLESQEISGAPERSLRPRLPNRRPQNTEETETTAEPNVDENSIAAALADAVGNENAASPEVPVGPPMNGSEREGFRVSVQNCWNVGALSTAGSRVTVTVAFELDRTKKVIGDDVRLVSGQNGDNTAIRNAYDVARRAILQCQTRNGGFDLPDEKFEQWKSVELTFDPSGMRLR